jgi:ubiquinone/menaquinone biosynthesis C-methylase UbiE
MQGAINLDVIAGNGVNVLGDARALPFGPGTMDRVVAERLPSLLGANPAVAGEIYRVLKTGGTGQLTSLSGFGPGAVQVFEQAGFRSVQGSGGILRLVK